jgi:RimJ/RimL family protein N-acetyltransferase
MRDRRSAFPTRDANTRWDVINDPWGCQEHMGTEGLVLTGRYVRLEPLDRLHVGGLIAASAVDDASLYQWSPVPRGQEEVTKYIETALAWRDAETAVPFATVRVNDGAVIGSTRFWNLERWSWPPGHSRQERREPDVCEIGYTWLTRLAIRTAANTEAKLLMLTHAFETWQVLRACFHTDARNQRSRAALERIGGKFEGILRAHRMAADYIPRDSVRYSIVASEWTSVKERLSHLLRQGSSSGQ